LLSRTSTWSQRPSFFGALRPRTPLIFWAFLSWLVGGPLHPYVWNLFVQFPGMHEFAMPNLFIHSRSLAGAFGMAVVLWLLKFEFRNSGSCTRLYLALSILAGLAAASIAAVLCGLGWTWYLFFQGCMDGCKPNTALSNTMGAIAGSLLVLFGASVVALTSCIVAGPIAYLSTRLLLFRLTGCASDVGQKPDVDR